MPTRAGEFARDMQREFRRLDTAKRWEWQCSWCPVPGYEHVDLAGVPKRKNGTQVLIEVELRRMAGVTNIIKIWRWLEKVQITRKPIVLQAFSSYYPPNRSQVENAKFIGKRMQKATGAKYVQIYDRGSKKAQNAFDYKPRKGGKVGAGRRHDHAVQLARRIWALLP